MPDLATELMQPRIAMFLMMDQFAIMGGFALTTFAMQ